MSFTISGAKSNAEAIFVGQPIPKTYRGSFPLFAKSIIISLASDFMGDSSSSR